MRKFILLIATLSLIFIFLFLAFYYRKEIEVIIKSDVKLVNYFFKKENINMEKILTEDLSLNSNYKNIDNYGFEFYIPNTWADKGVEDKIEINFNTEEYALVNLLKLEIEEETGKYIVSNNLLPDIEVSNYPSLEVNVLEISSILNSLPNIISTINVSIPSEFIDINEEIFPKYRIKQGNYEFKEIREINNLSFIIFQSNTKYIVLGKNEFLAFHIFIESKNPQNLNELLILLSKIIDKRDQSPNN